MKRSFAYLLSSLLLTAAACDAEPSDDTTSAADTEQASDGNADSCEQACGDQECVAAEDGSCLGDDPVCVPPSADPCRSCVEAACPQTLDENIECSGVDCLDYTVRIGSCGDATPYAPEALLNCVFDDCGDACNAGDGFECACI